MQYFQRGRLEHHPERRNTPYEVQISLLGEWLVRQQTQPGQAEAGQPLHARVEPFESSADMRYFEETGHSASYAFLRYWNTRNGLDSVGFPITEELQENGRPVQYFQRGRLEYRQERRGRGTRCRRGPWGTRCCASGAGWTEPSSPQEAPREAPTWDLGLGPLDYPCVPHPHRGHPGAGHRPARRPA